MNGGAYGDLFTQFPELSKEYTYFDMKPLHGSGYGPRTEVGTTEGTLQCTGGRRVVVRNGNKVTERQMRYWTKETLVVGRFITDGTYVYCLGIPDNSWTEEAGFSVYDLERVVGNDGTETVEPPFDPQPGFFT